MPVCGCKVIDILLKMAERLNSYECEGDFLQKHFLITI